MSATLPTPNILWIVTTQWRAQATGYAGDPNAHTPNLDAFAARAVNFAQAVTPHPFGPFARAALLTGVPSPENGIRDYHDPLPVTARTVAHRLGAAGYATGFFGKWHLAGRDPAAPPVGERHAKIVVPEAARGGFEFWEGFESGFLINDPWLHGSRLPQPARFPGYQSDVLCSRAADWLDSARDRRPLFCVVSLEPPHPPYAAPVPALAAGFRPRKPDELLLPPGVPRGGETEARARRELAGYYAHIAATDQAVGRLLRRVEGGDTVVVFTSVHGDMHGAHGCFRKGWPYEESVRVPLLVAPGSGSGVLGSGFGVWGLEFGVSRTATGRRTDAPVSLIDLPAWTLAWAGLQPSPSPGPQTPNPKPKTQNPARISMPSVPPFPDQCNRAWRGVRTAHRKLVLNPDGTPWLFFDLAEDPFESVNRAADPACRLEIDALRGAC